MECHQLCPSLLISAKRENYIFEMKLYFWKLHGSHISIMHASHWFIVTQDLIVSPVSQPDIFQNRFENFCSLGQKELIYVSLSTLSHNNTAWFRCGLRRMQNCFAVSKFAHLFVRNDLMVGKCDTIVGKFRGKLLDQVERGREGFE